MMCIEIRRNTKMKGRNVERKGEVNITGAKYYRKIILLRQYVAGGY